MQQAHATIPTQDRFVVVGRMDFLGLGKAPQRLFQQGHQRVRGPAGMELRFDPALIDQASEVESFVRVGQALENSFNLGIAVRPFAGELVGDRES